MKVVDWLLPGDQWVGRAGHGVRLMVLHITDGDSAAGAIAWWKRPEVDASAHYVVERDATIYRTVDEANTAWCNGVVDRPDRSNPIIDDLVRRGINPNRVTIGVEIVGRPGQPLPAGQWWAVRALVTDCCRRHAVPQDRAHVVGHYQIDGVNRGRCPSLSAAQWAEVTTPLVAPVATPAEQAALERAWWAQRRQLGEQVVFGHLTRPWGDEVNTAKPALVCRRGVLLVVAGQVIEVGGRATDDLVGYWERDQSFVAQR